MKRLLLAALLASAAWPVYAQVGGGGVARPVFKMPLTSSGALFSSNSVIYGSSGLLMSNSKVTGFSYLDSGSGTAPSSPPFFAFSSESYNPGSGIFYQPFVFQENLTCAGSSCGERDTMVVQLNIENGQASQFYNVQQTELYARSGTGLFSASNPYVLLCNASGSGPCAAATGISATAEAVGEEVDTDVRVASVVRKMALQLVSVSTDVGVATTAGLDGALIISNQTSGIGFKKGIIFGESAGKFGAYEDFLYAPSGPAPTNYINFPNLVVTRAGAVTVPGPIALSPPTTANAINIAQNPTNHAGVINFLNSVSASFSNVTAVDNAITLTAGVTGLQLLSSPTAMIPTTNKAVQLGGSSNLFASVWSDSYVVGGSTPTPTGTCATPAMAGGNTAGTITTTTGCGGTTIILTFVLTATTGWACTTTNQTVSTRVMPQTGSSTTTATFTGTTSNGDVLGYSCVAY